MGVLGPMTPVGMTEAIQKIPEYCMTVEVVSMQVELIKVRSDAFVKSVQNNTKVWSFLEEFSEEIANKMARRILNLNKTKGDVHSKFNSLTGHTSNEWQIGPYE